MTPSPRRLHPAAVLAEAVAQLRQLLLPLVIIAVVGGGGLGRLLVYSVVGVVVTIVATFVQWTRTHWRVDDASIRLEQGLFSRRETSVPLDRVQAIDTVRGPVQRLFGAVELHVQTAGGGAKGEIVLRAVAPEVADELRAVVRGSAPAAAAEPEEEGPEWRLGPRRLLVAALTSGSLGVLVPVVAGLSQILDDVLGAEDAQRLVPNTPREALLAAAAVLGVAWLLSFLGTIVAFAGFTVRRDGDRLRITRGIVERREASIPLARVAAIRIVESPLREPFGLAQVRLESAGYAKEAATVQALLPLVRRGEVEAALRELLPELAEGPAPTPTAAQGAAGAPGAAAAPLAPPPRRALRRYVLPRAAVAAVVPLVALLFLGPPALAALVLPLLAALYGAAVYRTAGWRLDADRLVLRRRGLQRTTLVADARRLPLVFARTSILQRRARLATAGVAVSSGRRTAVAHLDADTAADIVGRLTRAATGRA